MAIQAETCSEMVPNKEQQTTLHIDRAETPKLVSPRCGYLLTKLYGVVPQKTAALIFIVLRT
jgi:hypothetical protein